MNDNIIKMFIGGEEVVSNKEFTINEEMLSASSTILNNCYPASWEESKDYVSNFYYPKDYSKYILGKGNFTYGTEQYQILEAHTKNLWNNKDYYTTLPNFCYTINENGFTFTRADITGARYIAKIIPVKAGQTYVFSANIVENPIRDCYLALYRNNVYGIILASSYTGQLSYTATNDENLYFTFIINSTLKTAIVSNIQVETNTIKTNYTLFGKDLSFNSNVEKELNNFNIYGNTTQEIRSGKNLWENANYYTPIPTTNYNINNNGFTFTRGSLTGGKYISKRITVENGKTYTFHAISNDWNTNFYLVIYRGNVYGTTVASSYNGTIIYTSTANEDLFFTFIISSGQQNASASDIQVELGNMATNFEVYGKMPSPNFPSPLISLGYENLFDNYGVKLNTTWNNNAQGGRSVLFIETEPNTTYTISATNWNNLFYDIVFLDHIGATSFIYESGWNNPATYPSKTFTTTTGTNILALHFKYTNAGNVTMTREMFTNANILVTKSEKVHNYIPYGKYGIEIINRGINLLKGMSTPINNIYWIDVTSPYFTPLENGWGKFEIDNTNGSSTAFINAKVRVGQIDLKPNTLYTFIAEIRNGDVSENNGCFFQICTSNPTASWQTAKSIGYANINTGGKFILTSTTKSSFENMASYLDSYLRIAAGYKGTLEIRLSLIEGEYEASNYSYKPYNKEELFCILDEPIRSIGNIADKIYLIGNQLYVERNIKQIILNGTENWAKNTTNGAFYIAFSGAYKSINNNDILGYSNYFRGETANHSVDPTYNYCMGTNTAGYTWFRYNEISTVNDFKNWLANTNPIVLFVLSQPILENLNITSELVSYDDTNIFDIYGGKVNGFTEIYYYWKNYDVLFAGIVKNSGDISLRPTDPKYCSLQILDYKTFLSESDTLDFVISDKTIAEAISMVVDAISGYGFILGTINISQADDIIGAYSTLNKTAYDVFQYLANISGSRWRARFVDSDTMAIDFYDPELLPRANDIDYTQQYWEDNKIVDLTFNYGTRDYRNKQIILSDEVYGGIDYTEVLLSNGYGTSYITQNNIANITSITVNGVEAEVITQSEKDLGVDADFYYTPGKNVVESTTSYTAGTQIIITYTPLVKGRQIVYNDEEVTRIATQTNTTGVISRYENRNDILSSDELENIAETYIKYKGKPEIILKLTTLNNDLFSIGEICYFNSPIADLAQDYMVKSKATNYTSVAGETNIFYTYELTSSFNSEKAICLIPLYKLFL